jgi:hypothetical protein
VIVHNLNIVGLAVTPNEADSPLIVDPDAVLTRSTPFQCLQTITGRDAKVFKTAGCVKIQEPAACYTLNRIEPAHKAILEQSLGVFARERSNQAPAYYGFGIPSRVIA